MVSMIELCTCEVTDPRKNRGAVRSHAHLEFTYRSATPVSVPQTNQTAASGFTRSGEGETVARNDLTWSFDAFGPRANPPGPYAWCRWARARWHLSPSCVPSR